jgi:fatty-acid desaturase
MLPARDPPLLASRAARLERTVTARIGPIAPQQLPVLLVGVVVCQLFASRTAIHILVAKIDKVLLAEATPCLNARGHRFGKRNRNVGFVTFENFFTAVVAAIGNGFELVDAKDLLRLASDIG